MNVDPHPDYGYVDMPSVEKKLRGFFEEQGVDYPYRPWKTQRWKSRRDAVLSEECVRCGDGSDLQVHHRGISPEWKSVFVKVRNDVFFQTEYEPARYAPLSAGCPNCRRLSYRGRVTKHPVYKCEKCLYEFDNPLLMPRNGSDTDTLRDSIKTYQEENFRLLIDRFAPVFWDRWDEYFTTDDVETLCKSCHHFLHK